MRKLSTKQACELARALEGVTEKDHFGSDAFIANKRIFATVWHEKNTVTLMLNQEQQREFLVRDSGDGFRTIDNAWGKNAISAQLEFIERALFEDALKAAWVNSANKRTAPGKKKAAKKKPAKKKK